MPITREIDIARISGGRANLVCIERKKRFLRGTKTTRHEMSLELRNCGDKLVSEPVANNKTWHCHEVELDVDGHFSFWIGFERQLTFADYVTVSPPFSISYE